VSEERTFELLDVISATSGYLVTDKGIGAVYDVLNFMTGESIYTHQIPRVSREARAAILVYHPWLAEVFEESKSVTKDNWREFATKWESEHGIGITVRQMTVHEHERIDPRSELVEMVHPSRIIEI
jgi:cytochrome c